MYKLACGGWIHKNYAEPVTGDIDIYNHVGEIDYQMDQKSEQLILKGTANPIFTSSWLEDKLIVRLYNTDGISDISSSIYQNSSLFSNISAQSGANYVDIIFSFKSKNAIWGYNIEFDGNNTIVYAKKKPVLFQNAEKPLTGVTVVVDPGHGGSDSGAPGIIGSIGGSCEKDVNLVNALAVRKRLESLGATVVLTRENDKFISLYDRVAIMEKLKPDFIVSMHGNSIEKSNVDVKGTEIYYSNPMSVKFAKSLSDTVSSYAERYNRGAKSKEFYVIRSTYCPSILAEIGFLTSPKDVASMMSASGIFNVANAFGDSIVNYIINNSQQ
jgi:N-acetylmuramoyl-L-alanine amidase